MITILIFTLLSITVNFAVTKFISIPSGKTLHLGKYHLHHSIHAVVFVMAGFLVPSFRNILTGIGIGIFLEHGFEEWYLHRINPLRGLFLFISDYEKKKRR